MKYKLGEICEIVSGSTPKTTVEEYWDGDIKWITPAEITEDSYIINDSARKITELGVKKTGLTPFPEGTVILSSRAPIGKVAIAGCEMYCNQGFKNLICSDKINNKYLYWFLRGNTGYLNSLGRGATFKEISKGIVSEIIINVPDIDDQIAAVNNLEKINGIIKLRKQELVELDCLIKARFVEMFGDAIKNDKEWKSITLLESLESGRTVSYGIVQTGDDYENGVPVFRPVDIAGGHIPKRQELKRTAPAISAQYKRTVLKGNELLVTVRGSVGETFQTTEEFEGCNVGRNIVPLLTDESKVKQRFLQELFASDSIKRWLKGITKGIALQGLNMSEFKEMPVITPPIDIQNQFVLIAEQVDKSKVIEVYIAFMINRRRVWDWLRLQVQNQCGVQ
ncbi:MAG: restriction endonuclease subunit S [Eubacterium sp.]|nr:restriction endonuclease subunit S [Eubacterium sp.]